MSESSLLENKRCIACDGSTPALDGATAQSLLDQLAGWQRDGDTLVKSYRFKDHYETMAFVNAVAWISHREDHHPDLMVGYNECKIRYSTHAVNGLSENDFICAAKVDALLRH